MTSAAGATPSLIAGPETPRYGAPVLVRPRLGQGTFRVAVMDAYARTCAVTGEHSLPALEAAHIRAYTSSGPHEVKNQDLGFVLAVDGMEMGRPMIIPVHMDGDAEEPRDLATSLN